MPYIGAISEFNPTTCDFKIYIERLEVFFTANTISDGKKVSVLLTLIGEKCYGVLRDLISPALPTDKTYEQIVTVLTEHYSPAKSEIAERFKFLRRRQGTEESIADYVAGLKKLASSCNYGTFLNTALRDKFVEGIYDVKIQRELLQKATLTYEDAVRYALAFELTTKTANELKIGSSESTVYKINSRPNSSKNMFKGPESGVKKHVNDKEGITCFRCKGNHLANQCRFKSYKCNNCKKVGHLARACKILKVNNVERKEKSDLDSSDNEYLYAIGDKRCKYAPVVVNVSINDKSVLMEVDTGSAVTVMSEKLYNKMFPEVKLQRSSSILFTYSKEQLKLIGEVKVTVKYGRKTHNLPVQIIEGNGPTLMGRDWLRFIKLDWKNILNVVDIEQILVKFEKVFSDTPGIIKDFTATFQLKENASPKFCKARPVPYALREKVSMQLETMEKQGIIEKVDHSSWATPIVCIAKKDDKVRICGDYRSTLNKSIDVNTYPFPTTQDLFASLSGGKKFTKLDLSRAYEQVEVATEQQELLTLNTHKGLYKVKRLLYGVSSAPAIFQKIMDTVLKGIRYVGCLLDDIIITGIDDKEHMQNLEQVFERLSKYNIKLNKKKCKFLQDEIEYLGHKISAKGIYMTESKIESMTNAPVPKNVSELRSFLGLVNYYCNFIGDLSTHLKPLYDLTTKNTKYVWSENCQHAFEHVKRLILSNQCLTHYDPNLEIRLASDASSYGLGCVLSHLMPDGKERPIAFASRTLSKAEKNYSQIEREALSIVFGVTKFHMYLSGRNFKLITDHKPLTILFGSDKQLPVMAAARIQRWAMLLGAYNYSIIYRPTDKHSNADFLSRLPCKDVDCVKEKFRVNFIDEINIDYKDVVKFSKTDQILNKVMYYVRVGWPKNFSPSSEFQPFFSRREELSLEQGCLIWGHPVIIPRKLRSLLLKELHSTHIGIVRSKMLARSYFWWPKIDEEIESIIKFCKQCQFNQNKPHSAPMSAWPSAHTPWERIHIDFLEYGKLNYLIVVDAFSNWPEVFKMNVTTSSATIKHLRYLFAAYGLPKVLVSDNGPQLVSAEFKAFLEKNSVKHLTSSAYKARQNGQVERFVQTFKNFLRKNVNSDISLNIARFLFSYRNTPNALTGRFPSSLFLNREIRSKFSVILPDSSGCSKIAHKYHNVYESVKTARKFNIGDKVLYCNEATDKNWKFGKILSVQGNVNYKIESEGRSIVRHVDQIVKYNESEDIPGEYLSSNPISKPNADLNNSCNNDGVNFELRKDSPNIALDSTNLFSDSGISSGNIRINSDDRTGNSAVPNNMETVAEPNETQNIRRYPSRIRKAPERLNYA